MFRTCFPSIFSISALLAALPGLDVGAGGGEFVGHELSTWKPGHFLAFILLVVGLSEFLDVLCLYVCEKVLRLPLIPNTGKHLDDEELTIKDRLYMAFNRLVTSCGGLFFCMRLEAIAPPDQIVRGGFRELTLANTVVAGLLAFLCHDLLWTPLHRLFHSHGTLYKLVHKYHHKQLAPSRGLRDAFLTSTPEAVIGLAIHCWAIWVVPTFLVPMHLYTARAIVPLAQIQATIQHCRFDIRSPIDGAFLDAGSHDLHHWDPSCNCGLYTNVIDKLMGTHKRPKYKGSTQMANA